ncbi:MAG: LamG domain-containing protein, partial [Treponema sp.]|nr:LamG domain-containing protein [Treponema sp.]
VDTNAIAGASTDNRGRWRNIVVTSDSATLCVYMDGVLTRQGPTSGQTMFDTTQNNQFNYAYLGRSIFWSNGDTTLRTAQYYQFSLYDGALDAAAIHNLGIMEKLPELNGPLPVTGFTFTPAAGLKEGDASVDTDAVVGNISNPLGGYPPYVYSLVAGSGDTDNSSFVLTGTQLKVGATPLTAGVKTVRIRVVDDAETSFERICPISVTTENEDPLQLHFTFDNPYGDLVVDQTGTYTGTMMSGATIQDYNGIKVLNFAPAGNQWFDMGSTAGNIISTSPDFTVSTYMYVGSSAPVTAANGFHPWVFSSADTSSDTNTSRTPGIWYQLRANNAEVDLVSNFQGSVGTTGQNNGDRQWNYYSNLTDPRGTWYHVVYTQQRNGTTGSNSLARADGKLYINGALIGTKTDCYDSQYLTNMVYNWLGRPAYNNNTYMLDTKYADFRVYNEALDATAVTALNAELSDKYAASALYIYRDEVNASPFVTEYLDNLEFDVTLPAGNSGVNVSWVSSNPAVLSNTGIVTRPSVAAGDATVTLTATYTLKSDSTKTLVVPYTATVKAENVDLDHPILAVNFDNDTVNATAGTATLQGSVTYDNGYKDGVRAAVFNGNTANYISAGNDSGGSLLAGHNEFSVSFWLKSSAGIGWWSFAAPNSNTMVAPEYYLAGYAANNTNRAMILERWYNGRNAPAAFSVTTANSAIPNGEWHHVIIEHGVDSSAIYIDGDRKAVGYGTATVTDILGSSPIYLIGHSTWNEGANGSIADYRVYDGVLTTGQARLLAEVLPADDVARKIATVDAVLKGDLSTFDAVGTIPVSDANVTVTWSTSDPSVINNGIICRPTGAAPVTADLTAVFTSVWDPSVTETKTWENVRIMHTGAIWSDYLNVYYAVDENGVFRNLAPSGDYYTPTLMDGAVVEQSASANAQIPLYNNGYYVNVGNGYIDLGPKVGAILRKTDWVIEFYIHLPDGVTEVTPISFANDANITDTNSSPWRGTFSLSQNALNLRALYNGANGWNLGSNSSVQSTGISTGNSGGITTGRTNMWLNLMLVKVPAGNCFVERNWGRAQNQQDNTGYNQLATDPRFGSGDPSVDDFRYAYLGKSIFANAAGVSGGQATGTPGAFYYELKVYSKSPANMPSAGDPFIDAATKASNIADKAAMNTAFGYGNTD